MIDSSVKTAFNFPEPLELQKLSTGLINHTYKVMLPDGQAFLLQSINTTVFKNPDILQQNYLKIQKHFVEENSYQLPAILKTRDDLLLFKGEKYIWRCFEFIKDTYSPLVSSTPEEAYKVAGCFGNFSATLSTLNPLKIQVVLPRFHDLVLRFEQFTTALHSGASKRRQAAKAWIDRALEHSYLVDFYRRIEGADTMFPLHILHHDCKIANILFKKQDNQIYSPIDLDTTQPGLFVSDMGDMIRSMVPNYPENHASYKELVIRGDFYEAIRQGYLDAMHKHLTTLEMQQIDMSGQVIIYMQALRFLTDYLNGDIYYQTSYPEQNLDRTANQFQLLTLLIEYVEGHNKTKRKVYS